MTLRQLRDAIGEAFGTIPWNKTHQPTLPATSVPPVLHEPAILAGYRLPYKPWSYYFLSIFQLHNETVNVWSHLIGCCVILHKLYGYFTEFSFQTDRVLWVLIVYGSTCIIVLLSSAIVHMLHGKSPFVHFVAVSVDYIGATLGGFGAGYAAFYGLSDENFYREWDGTYLLLLVIVGYCNCLNMFLAKIWYGHDPHNMFRKYMFIGGMSIQGLVNSLPLLPRYISCYYSVTCSLTSLNHLTISVVVFISAAIAFAAHLPEKIWPGKFDLVGHGHQWFHLLIAASQVLTLDAIYQDHVTGWSNHKEPNLPVSICIIIALYMADLFTLYALTPRIQDCLRNINLNVQEDTKRDK